MSVYYMPGTGLVGGATTMNKTGSGYPRGRKEREVMQEFLPGSCI